MHIIEYIIPLPFTLDQYRVGYQWSQLEFSKMETGGGSGVEFVDQYALTDPEPGRYTHRVYYLEKKFPKIVTKLIPLKYFQVQEKSSSLRNFTETSYYHESLSAESFSVTLTSTSGQSKLENAFNLTDEELEIRKCIFVDITTTYDPKDYDETIDPTKFRSQKLQFGPLLNSDWTKSEEDHNLLYVHKLYKFSVALPMFNQVKPKVVDNVNRMINKFYRCMYCWCDHWLDYSYSDVEAMEETVKNELIQLRKDKEARGISA